MNIVIVLLLSVTGAIAQTPPPLACTAQVAVTPIIRAEADADFIGNYVLVCTGGTPTAAGVAIPMENISFFLSTGITSRLLSPDWSEALLIADEPAPGSQLVCGAPGTTEITAGVCTILGTGTGIGVYSGAAGRPNVFQARMGTASNAIFWTIPFDAPPMGGMRIFRIANVRANAAALGTGPFPVTVNADVAISGAMTVGITNPVQPVAFVERGLSTSVPTVLTLNRCNPQNAALFASPAASGTPTFSVRLAENFTAMWLTRTVAAFINSNTSPPPVPQDTPGAIFNSETGFYHPGFPSLTGRGNLALAGLAEQGTRLHLQFTAVPGHLKLFTQTVANLVKASDGTPTGGVARLISVAPDGAGPFAPTPGNAFGIAEIPIAGGNAHATFEILRENPFLPERADVPIYLAYIRAQHGTAKVAGSFAPISTVHVASQTAPVPRFIDSGVPENAFILPAACH